MAEIDNELNVIKNGRYGSDIRMAIHDAIKKVNQNGGSSGGGTLLLVGDGIVDGSGISPSKDIVAIAEVDR